MSITIKLQEDKQLRAEIKKLVEGQIKSYVRSEMQKIIDSLIKETVEKAVTSEKINERVISRVHSLAVGYYDRDKILKQQIQEYIYTKYNAYIQEQMAKLDFQEIAREMIKEKFR